MSAQNDHSKPNNYLHYKDYAGSVAFSEADAVFHGRVIGIKSLISFEGDSVSAIIKDFHHAVDEYLEFCAEIGKQPEKPFKGSFCQMINSVNEHTTFMEMQEFICRPCQYCSPLSPTPVYTNDLTRHVAGCVRR